MKYKTDSEGRRGWRGVFNYSTAHMAELKNPWEPSGEAADQAMNAESTKRRAVNEKWSPILLPEVFAFMVHAQSPLMNL